MRAAVMIVSLSLFACGAKTEQTSSPLPCDVDAVLGASCRSCHGATPSYGAPMPLVTWEDLNAPAKTNASKKVYELVGARIHDDAHPMPQAPNPRLDASATGTLDRWIAAGAPKSSVKQCEGQDAGSDAPSTNASCTTPDVDLAPASAWQMPLVNDVYTCYGVDVPVTGARQTIAIKPRVDNKSIVHHIVLFGAPSSVDPTPHTCQAFGLATWSFVYAWAPGIGDFELPPEAGFPMSDTMHYVVQVHYNNIQKVPGQSDKSGFGLCTTDKLRPNDADVVAFGSNSFSIAPHATMELTCNYTLPPTFDGKKTFSTFLHMHKIGVAISNTITPSGGASVTLGSDPNYTFEGQRWSTLSPAVDLHYGDMVQTKCKWVNGGDVPVRFGENTEDEMCFAFAAYYPKAKLLSWALPAYTSKCTTN